MSDELRQDSSDDFEAHRKKWSKSEDADPPADLGEKSEAEQADEDDDELDVEAHRKKWS